MEQIETKSTPVVGSSILQRSIRFQREIGLLPAISFAFGAIGLSLGGLLPYAVLTGLFPGVKILEIVLAALAASLIFGTIYSSIGALVPHDGADYVLTSRIFGGAVGFATSFSMVMLLALSAGAIISMLTKLILPGLLVGYGLIQTSTIGDLGTSVAQSGTSIIIATMLVIFAFGMAIVPRRYIRWSLAIGAVLTLAAWVWIILTFVGRSGSLFPAAWDSAMGLENYVSQIRTATTAGMINFQDPILAYLAGGALSLWMFFGSFSLVNASGEMKNPGRDLPLSHLISVLVAGGLLVGVVLVLRNLILPTWYSAVSYLFMQGGDVQSMPWVFFYAAIFHKSPVFLMFLLVVWIIGFINLLQTIFYYSSRIIWAWGKDRIFQEGLSFVHASWRSPLVATLFFAVLTQLGVVIAIQIPRLFLSRPYIIPMLLVLMVPLAALVVAGFRKQAWFEKASGMARWRIGRFPLVSAFAIIGIAYLAATIFILASGRLKIALFSSGDAWLVVGLFVLGLIWYAGRRSWLQRSQVELNDTFKDLPEA